MTKSRRNHDRENRIHEEIIVDAYGPEEQAMGWYYYLEDKLQFPFHAQCIASMPTSPLRKGDSVEIRKMAPEDSCSGDMLVMTLECPANSVPVEVRQTGMEGAWNGARKEA